ncbi:MAG: CoA transferase [Chloroflexota bacterium]
MLTTRPLSNLRVIDFGQYIAGPAVAMMLADQGAETIRVEPPTGPLWDSPTNAILNRNKKSIALDLKQETERQLCLQLITSADVVIENFRPGVMQRLGLGADEMLRLNPRLVYLSLPGFAHDDTEWANVQAWEGVIAAAVGQYMDMGLNRVLMGINPSFSPLPLASAYAAALGATAVTLALYSREQTGQGDIIEVPLAAAMTEGLAYNSMQIEALPERYLSRREREIERRQAAGLPMNLEYADLQTYLDPFYRSYVCANERPFYVVSASHTQHTVKTLQVLGLWEEMVAAGIPMDNPYLSSDQWSEACTLLAYPFTKAWADKLSARMQDAFLQRSSFEWEEVFGQNGLPGAAHRTTQEWINSEHALAAGIILEIDDPTYGHMRQAGNIGWLASDSSNVLTKQPAPTLNQHREEILQQLDELSLTNRSDHASTHNASVSQATKSDQGWLTGIKILDLTNVIAGPTIASTFARFGAEVIKVDNPKPTMDPWNTIIFGLQANRGKRSMLVDLKAPEGQEIIRRLIEEVDIVTINAVEPQLKRLGLTFSQIHAINPRVILCQIDAFGGPKSGPRSNYVGYDDLMQASSGIMERFGGSLSTPEEHAHLGTIDVLCGFCAAFALGVALIKREQRGEPDVARASLAAAGQLLQLPFMYDYATRAPFDEPRGRESKGWGPFYHCYEAQDGWFFLGAKLEKRSELATIPELFDIMTISDEELTDYLIAKFRGRPVSYWNEALRARDIGICDIASMSEVRAQNLFQDDSVSVVGRSTEPTNILGGDKSNIKADFKTKLIGKTFAFNQYYHPELERVVDLCAPSAIRPHCTQIRLPSPASKYGHHTREILRELGYSLADIESLLVKQAVSESWSEQYLPD